MSLTYVTSILSLLINDTMIITLFDYFIIIIYYLFNLLLNLLL